MLACTALHNTTCPEVNAAMLAACIRWKSMKFRYFTLKSRNHVEMPKWASCIDISVFCRIKNYSCKPNMRLVHLLLVGMISHVNILSQTMNIYFINSWHADEPHTSVQIVGQICVWGLTFSWQEESFIYFLQTMHTHHMTILLGLRTVLKWQ